MKFKQSIRYDINIKPTPNNGFIVTVGCVQVAYSNFSSLVQDLTEYLADPDTIERQYMADIQKPDRVHLGPNAPLYTVSGIAAREESQYHKIVPTGGL